jgi:hypothetical protein
LASVGRSRVMRLKMPLAHPQRSRRGRGLRQTW